jgi:hypothetical protein
MNKIGFSKVFGFFFYYLSFHFVLKFIIRSRLGFTLKKKIDLQLQEIVENDEEMANAMCNSDNEDDTQEKDKPKKSFKKSIKISKSVNEILDEKKEKAKRKRLKRLQE